MPHTDPKPPAPPSSHASRPHRVAWVGGVLSVLGAGPNARAEKIAIWMTSGGSVLDAAIVRSGGPAVLRQMFDELLARLPEEQRPAEVTVWPSAKARFRDVAYPQVEIRKDMFLKIVADDQADFGHFPHRLPVRSA